MSVSLYACFELFFPLLQLLYFEVKLRSRLTETTAIPLFQLKLGDIVREMGFNYKMHLASGKTSSNDCKYFPYEYTTNKSFPPLDFYAKLVFLK